MIVTVHALASADVPVVVRVAAGAPRGLFLRLLAIVGENVAIKGPNISHRGIKHHTLQILSIYFSNSEKSGPTSKICRFLFFLSKK